MTYNKILNNAELAICDSAYQKASDYYKNAFNSFDYVRAKDLHNALAVSLILKDYDSALSYTQKLMLKGCDTTYFNKAEFKELRENKVLWENIIGHYDATRAKYLAKLDNKVKNDIELRFINDQKVDDPNRLQYFHDNILWLKSLMDNGKFPNEDVVGLRIEGGRILTPIVDLFLMHWCDNVQNDTLKLRESIIKQIVAGNILPEVYASLNNLHEEPKFSAYGNIAYVVMDNSVLSPIFDSVSSKTIDSNRLSIGMPIFKDYQKIVKYNHFDRRFIFTKAIQVEILNFDNKESATSATEAYEKMGFGVIGDKKRVLNLDE